MGAFDMSREHNGTAGAPRGRRFALQKPVLGSFLFSIELAAGYPPDRDRADTTNGLTTR